MQKLGLYFQASFVVGDGKIYWLIHDILINV
jgi:hypothetical protein